MFSSSRFTATTNINARYNSLTLPISTWMVPFFDMGFPDAVNFGHLGSLAGHELSHGFDFGGIYWDKNGAYVKLVAAHVLKVGEK